MSRSQSGTLPTFCSGLTEVVPPVVDWWGPGVCIWGGGLMPEGLMEGSCAGTFKGVLQWYVARGYQGLMFEGLMEGDCAGAFQGGLLF